MIKTLTLLLSIFPLLVPAQNKFPPKDESGKTQELHLFVIQLKEIIRDRDSQRLMQRVHPKIKFDFDEGVGAEKFKVRWKPEDPSSRLWVIMNRIVALGGVFARNRTNPFFDFVFPYVNQVELQESDQYFSTLIVTGKNVNVREKPALGSNVVGQLTYDVVNYEYEKSDDAWTFISTRNGKISGYVSSDFVYSPVDYRMFLTHENGKWMISCLIAGD